MIPRILVIAGSDSGGGAGIQADIKTISALGGHTMTAITAITAQNTLGVTDVLAVPAGMVLAQIDAVVSDIGVDAVKIGMIGSADIANAVAGRLERLDVPIVFDPVMVATSGSMLADANTIAAFSSLLKICRIATPNTPELEALAGQPVGDEASQQDAAEQVMRSTGCRAILAKGGHWPGGTLYGTTLTGTTFRHATDNRLFDCLYELDSEGWHERIWDHPKIDTVHTHGTGCTLASAVATGLGAGLPLAQAVKQAIDFVQAALAAAPGLGKGSGPLGQQFVR